MSHNPVAQALSESPLLIRAMIARLTRVKRWEGRFTLCFLTFSFMKQRILALAAALLLSGCATIVGNETQSVRIDSLPQGARFTVQDERGFSVAQGFTPQTVELEKFTGRYFGKKHYLLMLESPGYVPVTMPIEARANLWYLLGNIPLGGFPGWLLVDPFYGGMYDLKPEHPRPFMNPVGARG